MASYAVRHSIFGWPRIGTFRAFEPLAESSRAASGKRNGCRMSKSTRAEDGRLDGVEGCCLFAMECGGQWPTWMPPPPSSRVLVQTAQESPGAFASRVVRAIAAVRGEREELGTVVIAAGRGIEHEQVLDARSRITQAAAKAMNGGPGLVLLSAHRLLPMETRHELLSTAGALAAQLRGSAIEIRVRFDAPPLLRSTSKLRDESPGPGNTSEPRPAAVASA
jgi:hypothetical protein